jgi:hypothetical protein
VTGANCEESFE